MGIALRYLFYLVVLCAIVVAAYALFFDLPAPQSKITKPVETELTK